MVTLDLIIKKIKEEVKNDLYGDVRGKVLTEEAMVMIMWRGSDILHPTEGELYFYQKLTLAEIETLYNPIMNISRAFLDALKKFLKERNPYKVKQVLNVEIRDGYRVRHEIWIDDHAREKYHKSGYNLSGDYIGDSAMAKELIENWGIYPQVINKGDAQCSIGYSSKDQRWYGWTFKGICGFGLGDMLYEANFGNDEVSVIKHGSVKIMTLEQAKQSAINFVKHMLTK